MANAREIKSRISSVQDTMKITNAMYMISSSKMKKAKKILSDTEPYFYNMQGAIARILRHVPDIQHPFFSVRHLIPQEERKIATIVVTGDKGMAGAYNHNITRMTEESTCQSAKYRRSSFDHLTAGHLELWSHLPVASGKIPWCFALAPGKAGRCRASAKGKAVRGSRSS